MEWLIWSGAVVTLIGLFGVISCIVGVARARKSGLDDAVMRALVQRMLPRNLGALFLSVIGLMMVIMGISFG